MDNDLKKAGLVWITLLCSSSTLICCTLPIILVALGFGAALASVSAEFSWWIVLAQNKFYLFLISGILLLVSFWTLKKLSPSCPTDPILAAKCQKMRKWNIWVLRISV